MSDEKSKVTDKASEIAKNIWLAGVGAYGKAVEDAQGRLEKAGVEPPKLFKELVKAGTVDAYEVLGREVVLYWRVLQPEERVELPSGYYVRFGGQFASGQVLALQAVQVQVVVIPMNHAPGDFSLGSEHSGRHAVRHESRRLGVGQDQYFMFLDAYCESMEMPREAVVDRMHGDLIAPCVGVGDQLAEKQAD